MLILRTALALTLLAPLASARADSSNFCTTGLSLNFCGSVVLDATPNSDGGTDVSLDVINTPIGSSLAGPSAIGMNTSVVGASLDPLPTSTRGTADNVSSACSGTFDRIYRCERTPVLISFSAAALTYALVSSSGSPTSSANAATAATDVIVNPEPATIALVATGLLGLGGPLARWRRRRK